MRDHKPISLESHLANLPLFSGMGMEDIEHIARSAHLIHAKRGDVLLHAGDLCTGLHLLVFGQIKLAFTSPHGAEKVVEIVQPGQSFGEALIFLDENHLVVAQALKDSLLIHVARTAILEELERDRHFTRKMLGVMAKRTYDLMADIEAYSLQSAKQRVIGYLMTDLSREALDANRFELELTVGKGVIASRLNITQEHFSRVLHVLSGCGLLEVRGRKIRVPNVSGLLQCQASESFQPQLSSLQDRHSNSATSLYGGNPLAQSPGKSGHHAGQPIGCSGFSPCPLSEPADRE